MRIWKERASTNIHGGWIRSDGDRETKSAFRVDSLAPNVPKRRRGGLRNDERVKALGGGRPKIDESMERRLAKAEARIKYLTVENELLKKLEKLEGQAKHTN